MCLLFCFVIFWMLCCIMCEKKNIYVDNKKKKKKMLITKKGRLSMRPSVNPPDLVVRVMGHQTKSN